LAEKEVSHIPIMRSIRVNGTSRSAIVPEKDPARILDYSKGTDLSERTTLPTSALQSHALHV